MKKAKNINREVKHYEPFLFLMVATILVITGFQAYWLKNNYDREKHTMEIKANVAFQEIVRHLQAVKLKLKDPLADSLHSGKMRVFVDHDLQENVKIKGMPRQEIITMVNAMRDKMNDSLKGTKVNSTVIISMNKNRYPKTDSLPAIFERRVDGNNNFFRFLYGVDSLQDSLKIPEIATAYKKRMEQEKLSIPFNIAMIDKFADDNESDFSNVTIGFAHPVTYHLELGNTFPYLIKRITLPILFSIFLVGVTILSFLMLYRNLIKQRKLAELKNEFIGNITHELKTPIATVGVAIEALRNFNAIHDPQRTKEYLDISANELQRLSLLVDKVLKLSMFEKKEVELKKEPFDMHQLVDEVLSIMKLQFEKQQANVSVKTEGNDFTIEADRLHITSVLYNLLDNALKYSQENPVIEVKLSALPRDIIELKVSDNGIGIAKEYRQKVFEKFFRVPMGDKHNIKGYGLGLSYVSEIVKRHMGYITVDSELGKGTTFTVKLPRKEADVIYFDDKRKIMKYTFRLGAEKKDKQA
ncbi:MAG TPA: HAMP domain-containing sensor histidine kinase [Chitinophagaceae bacterium]|jgi:two-component system phosphate regulon sensor histidine kinase PhoR|nr:HAMP domain-containing sensor histidine kinase [Chitinophagaceae bacterium]